MSNITDLPYKNGLISQSFWFSETRTVIKLMAAGISLPEIRKRCNAENLFGMANEGRIKEVSQRITKRCEKMDDALVRIYMDSDLATQKLINLIIILRNDHLFFDFINEVYKEKNILGQFELTLEDVNVFMTRKDNESDVVAGWKDVTKRRLRNTYLNFMTDAGLLSCENKRYTITVPIMDIVLERKLIADGEESLVKAITGVR